MLVMFLSEFVVSSIYKSSLGLIHFIYQLSNTFRGTTYRLLYLRSLVKICYSYWFFQQPSQPQNFSIWVT